jgi:hypothetical protein
MLPGRPERSYAEHTEIVEAIAAHDPGAAEQAMRLHLSHVAEALRSHSDADGPGPIQSATPTGAGPIQSATPTGAGTLHEHPRT